MVRCPHTFSLIVHSQLLSMPIIRVNKNRSELRKMSDIKTAIHIKAECEGKCCCVFCIFSCCYKLKKPSPNSQKKLFVLLFFKSMCVGYGIWAQVRETAPCMSGASVSHLVVVHLLSSKGQSAQHHLRYFVLLTKWQKNWSFNKYIIGKPTTLMENPRKALPCQIPLYVADLFKLF